MGVCQTVSLCGSVWECVGVYMWNLFALAVFQCRELYICKRVCVSVCARVFVFALLGLALSAFSHCYANFPDIHHIRFHYPLAGPPPPPPPAHNRWRCSPAVLHRVNSPCAWALK